MQWPAEAIDAPRATLVGAGRVLIENHMGITEFIDERVRLKARGGEIVVEGSGLSLGQIRDGSLIIKGHISSVGMPEGDGENG